jgi:NAD(P)-dependent dehydrogenase (short-subunit alcohol dehydrogenase family)
MIDQSDMDSTMEKETFAAGNLFDLKGRVALVTGGTSGIGFMMAQGLIVNGCETVFITGNEVAEVIQENILILQKLADDVGLGGHVYGYLPFLL